MGRWHSMSSTSPSIPKPSYLTYIIQTYGLPYSVIQIDLIIKLPQSIQYIFIESCAFPLSDCVLCKMMLAPSINNLSHHTLSIHYHKHIGDDIEINQNELF